MSKQHGNEAPVVLLATKHQQFADAVTQQLTVNRYTVRALSPEQALEQLCSGNCSPVAAFVDCDASAAEGSPLYRAIPGGWPLCQIILICTPQQASTGADLARSGDVWDYLLTDSARDPNRVPLLLERVRANLPNDQDSAQPQYRQLLQSLAELRDSLKHTSNSPFARLLDKFKLDQGGSPARNDLLEEMVEAYGNSLIELVCGRLRDLESQILLLQGKKTPEAGGSAGGQILVVDDDPISGELAKYILERNGFEVVVATAVEAARAALNKQPPALVLMDVHLGDDNGLQLIKSMRRGNTCPDVPVIVVTADRMRATLLDAVGVHVQGYLLKPYQPSLLVEKVKAVLAGPRLAAEHNSGKDHACQT